MATDQEKTRFPLKLLVDEKRNRVIVAEGGKDFVDTIFSFLTLPMGTITRITGNRNIPENGVMGGMHNLYQSVKDLGEDNFAKEVCKSSLLNPRNPCMEICGNLRVQIDDSSPEKCYICSYCRLVIIDRHAVCRSGERAKEEMLGSSRQGTGNESRDVFLRGGTMFIVSDDLQVTPCSPTSLVQQLSNLGITDMTQLAEMSVEAGIEEISSLLKCSLISKSPLTDVFLIKQGKSKNPLMPEPRNLAPFGCEVHPRTSTSQLSLKLVLSKSTNRILCAEASDDFVNFLFSFLTISLGSGVKLLHGQTGLECIDNLYKSVDNLESKWLCIEKNTRLNAGVAKEYEYWNHPMGIQNTLTEWNVRKMKVSAEEQICGRFMKTPRKFLVSDDLAVRDLSSTSCVGFLKGLNVPFCDIEERIVTVGEAEALGILKASLTSSSALTNGLNSLLRKHKREESAHMLPM